MDRQRLLGVFNRFLVAAQPVIGNSDAGQGPGGPVLIAKFAPHGKGLLQLVNGLLCCLPALALQLAGFEHPSLGSNALPVLHRGRRLHFQPHLIGPGDRGRAAGTYREPIIPACRCLRR